MSDKSTKPAPAETGDQKDDNIDDLGRRPDGKVQDQPVNGEDDGAPPENKTGR